MPPATVAAIAKEALMRFHLTLALSFLLPAAAVAAPPSPPRPIALSELSFAGIALGNSEALVRKTLGKPRDMTGKRGDPDYTLHYPGLDVIFYEEGKVTGLNATAANRCTPSGVCPGQTLTQAQAHLGKGTPATPVEGAVEYYVKDESCWLQLDLDSESTSRADAGAARIKNIAVVCAP